ncbi:MAG: hypothetical protein ACWGON_00575 [Gemmatimonadota bacterium]
MRRKTSLAFFAALMVFGATTLSAQDATPPVPSHDMAGKENCAMCHGEGVMGAPVMPAFHKENGYENAMCMACHAESSPAQAGMAAPEIPHDAAGKENCAMCHGEGVMGAPKTPESHAEIEADQCSICHSPAG